MALTIIDTSYIIDKIEQKAKLILTLFPYKNIYISI